MPNPRFAKIICSTDRQEAKTGGNTFTIKPRPRNDGVTLTSDALSFPMWHRKTEDVIGYARFRAGNKSARIDVFKADGGIVETIDHDPGRRDNANTLGGV